MNCLNLTRINCSRPPCAVIEDKRRVVRCPTGGDRMTPEVNRVGCWCLARKGVERRSFAGKLSCARIQLYERRRFLHSSRQLLSSRRATVSNHQEAAWPRWSRAPNAREGSRARRDDEWMTLHQKAIVIGKEGGKRNSADVPIGNKDNRIISSNPALRGCDKYAVKTARVSLH